MNIYAIQSCASIPLEIVTGLSILLSILLPRAISPRCIGIIISA